MSLLAAFPLAVQTSLAKTLREAAIRDGVSLAQLLAAARISGTDQEQERIFERLLNALDDFDVVELWLGTLGSAWLSSGSALRVLEMIQGGVSTRHQEVESVEFTGEDEEAELEAVLCKVEICLPGLPESASHNAGSSTVPIGTSVGTDAELASSRAARAPARARARAARCAVATTHAAAAAAATAAASTPPPASAVAPSATPVSGEDQEHGSGLYDVDVRVGLCGWPPGYTTRSSTADREAASWMEKGHQSQSCEERCIRCSEGFKDKPLCQFRRLKTGIDCRRCLESGGRPVIPSRLTSCKGAKDRSVCRR